MPEAEVAEVAENLERRLKRDEFNARYRFREARGEGLVNCASCVCMTGGVKRDELALCQNPERLRKIKIAVHHEGFFEIKGESENVSLQRVCDAYKNKPLPEGAVLPSIPDKHAVVLGTQWRDPYHADPTCPYIVEEVRAMKSGQKVKGRPAEIVFVDMSEKVPGESIRDIC